MRDGVYLYLPSEIGIADGRDPNTPIQVIRHASEVVKANNRFKELGKLPITVRHPDEFLDHSDSKAWQNGEGTDPEIKSDVFSTVIDCKVNLKDKAVKDYQEGTIELSCGWSGSFEKCNDGEPYEYRQIFGDINHIAIVPAGRCGDKCKINDTIGGINMTFLDKLKLVFKSKGSELNDEDIKLLNLNDEGEPDENEDEEEEKKKEMDKKKTKDKKKKDEDPDENEDEDEEEEKKKEDKKKNKDAAIQDALIKDAYEKGKNDLRKMFLDGMNDVSPILDSFKPEEIKGKTPCEIKSMFIKRESDTDVKDSDPALTAVFNMLLKQYKHPAYSTYKRTDDGQPVEIADNISNLTFNKDKEVK